MIDISKTKVDVKCTKCGRITKVSIQQIADEIIVNCSCGTNIQLKDHNGSNRRSIQDVNKASKKLEDALKNLGKRR